MTLHERYIATFRKINPAKKYSEFLYYDMKGFDEISSGDIGTDLIFKINGAYYQFQKEQTVHVTDETIKSEIVIKDGRKEIHRQLM